MRQTGSRERSRMEGVIKFREHIVLGLVALKCIGCPFITNINQSDPFQHKESEVPDKESKFFSAHRSNCASLTHKMTLTGEVPGTEEPFTVL
jgi:hypothetical protein